MRDFGDEYYLGENTPLLAQGSGQLHATLAVFYGTAPSVLAAICREPFQARHGTCTNYGAMPKTAQTGLTGYASPGRSRPAKDRESSSSPTHPVKNVPDQAI